MERSVGSDGAEPASAEEPPSARGEVISGPASVRGCDTGSNHQIRPLDHFMRLGPMDARSSVCALSIGLIYFLIAAICLALSRFDSTLASIWLPNAFAVAALLRLQLRNEGSSYLAVIAASFVANLMFANSLAVSAIYTLANLTSIALVTGLTRRSCGPSPNMIDLRHLGRFLQYGGLLGPLVSTSIAASVVAHDPLAIRSALISWFLAESLGMVLAVPAILLAAEAVRQRSSLTPKQWVERIAMLTGGFAAAALVLQQTQYPLLFLIPPITLLVAFRLGGVGTAVFVPGIAILASAMAFTGLGPIAAAAELSSTKTYLVQAFVAANFLIGLPVAAILAGRARLTDDLTAGRRELSLLADNITDAVFKIDAAGKCTYASASVASVLGKSHREVLGEPIASLAHEDARERFDQAIKRLIDGNSQRERVTYRRVRDGPNGTPVFIEADCAIIAGEASGCEQEVVISARDVTERVELELLLTRSRRRAESAAHAKSEFLANMSHEIRTPMNGVLGFAELLLQGELDEVQHHQAEMIVQSGRSMMLLLNDILDLSKIEAGQVTIDFAAVDLSTTLSECAALHRPAAEAKGLDLVFDWDCQWIAEEEAEAQPARPWILSDALRLRQIVLNLVANAVKFTTSGRVRISYWMSQSQVTVEVSDTGVGIDPHRIEAIFNPFTQGDNDSARRVRGTGLGLSISRQLASLLGGFIEVESELGAGSTFRLTLPATLVESEDECEPGEELSGCDDMPRPARILLAEDHDINRLLATEMLERCGQSVAVAHDGNEAIAMVMDSVMRGMPFDLVLMDVQMPGTDGYAASQAIRAEGIQADTMPIVALTASAFPDDLARARAAGMQAHLSKPLAFAELVKVLQRWLPTKIVTPEHDAESQSDTIAADEDTALYRDPPLIMKWNARRRETLDAVREALECGAFSEPASDDPQRSTLIELMHKLAGSAGMFGEPELGEHAAALERGLKMRVSAEVLNTLAMELLGIADEPVDAVANGR